MHTFIKIHNIRKFEKILYSNMRFSLKKNPKSKILNTSFKDFDMLRQNLIF